MTTPLLVEDRGPVRILTLNRPEQLNAMDSDLYPRLIDALKAAQADDAVRVVVLRGAGTSFCSGADTREFSSLTPDQSERVEYRAGLTYGLHKTIPEMGKPVIAAVHGYAVGGGCGLALACDIAIAAELVSTGCLVSGAEAQARGMVTRAVPSGTEFDEAMTVAGDLSKRVPASLQATKRLFQAVADVPLAQGLELGRKANEAMRGYRAEALKNYASAVQASRDH